MLERCGRLWLSRRWPRLPQIQRHPASPHQRTTTTRFTSSSSPSPSTHSPPPPSLTKRNLPTSKPPPGLKTWHYIVLTSAATLLLVETYRRSSDRRVASSFKTYTLVSREAVSPTASVFRLRARDPRNALDEEEVRRMWRSGVWNVLVKQPQIQIVRAYTPLPPPASFPSGLDAAGGEARKQLSGKEKKKKRDRHGQEPAGGAEGEDEGEGELRFLIRRDPHGEVSSYLHRLPLGSDVELRGPSLEYAVSPEVRQVVFYAGGTGIATALQVAHAMFGDGEKARKPGDENGNGNGKKLHILWASRKREDCVGGVSDASSVVQAGETAPPKSTWSGLFPSASGSTGVASQGGGEAAQDEGGMVRRLNALKRRFPGQITVSYFVNAEGTYIDDDAVLRSLSHFDLSSPSSGDGQPGAASDSSKRREEKQIIISGPNGFISYLAGPKEWRGGKETQGDVKSVVAHAVAKRPVEGVKIWKI